MRTQLLFTLVLSSILLLGGYSGGTPDAKGTSQIHQARTDARLALAMEDPELDKQRADFKLRIDASDFDALSYELGGLRAVKVVVDRRPSSSPGQAARVYFLNSQIYPMHLAFIQQNKLVAKDQLPLIQLEAWRDEERRFFFCQLARYVEAGKPIYVVELFEEDRASADLIAELMPLINARVAFGPVSFKPNSLLQESRRARLEKAGIHVLPNSALSADRVYQVTHVGRPAVGRLRVITETDPAILSAQVYNRSDILLFESVPNDITRVAGIITLRPITPLSHVALRARAWDIPTVTFKEALGLVYREGLEDAWVYLEVHEDGLPLLRRATEEEVAMADAMRVATMTPLRVPRADLTMTDLTDIRQLRATDVYSVGAKAANLGEVAFLTQALEPEDLLPVLKAMKSDWLEQSIGDLPRHPERLPSKKLARLYLDGLHVPQGFAIPFSVYEAFLAHPANKAVAELLQMTIDEPRFKIDAPYRKKRLEALQEAIRRAEFPAAWEKRILARIHADLPDRRLFVRSSTNAEDLEDFNGAGLYETVGNVEGDQAVISAIKRVWASIWSFKAYEAREDAGISHRAVYPGVLIQEAVQPLVAGVMVTRDIFDDQWNDRYYLNANPGLGENTVNSGRGVPEQIFGNPFTGEVTRISLSERGGALLTDREVQQLVFFGAIIEQHFARLRQRSPFPQDIEWLVVSGRVSIVQTRPYLSPVH